MKNALSYCRPKPHSWRKPKIRQPVTIIIGIKCLDGITIAADSRTSEPSGLIRDNAVKCHTIEFQDGQSGILAEAGSADYSSFAIERMIALAKTKSLTDYRTMADCAQEAIAQSKDIIRRQHPTATAVELCDNIYNDRLFEWMLTHYYLGEPYIWTTNFVDGIVIKRDADYYAIGCGSILADFLISQLDKSLWTTANGIWSSFYAVEEIKKYDSRCGGHTRAALVNWRNDKSIATVCDIDDATAEAEREAKNTSDMFKYKWEEIADSRIKKVIQSRPKP